MSEKSIIVSGVAYYAACDPNVSGVPKEEGWPEPSSRRRGKGYQFVYPYSDDLAEMIASHLEQIGENFVLFGSDSETRAEGRATLRDAQRIRALMERA